MFEKIEPTNIRFIKLGIKGCWEKDCIDKNSTASTKIRFVLAMNLHQRFTKNV